MVGVTWQNVALYRVIFKLRLRFLIWFRLLSMPISVLSAVARWLVGLKLAQLAYLIMFVSMGTVGKITVKKPLTIRVVNGSLSIVGRWVYNGLASLIVSLSPYFHKKKGLSSCFLIMFVFRFWLQLPKLWLWLLLVVPSVNLNCLTRFARLLGTWVLSCPALHLSYTI